MSVDRRAMVNYGNMYVMPRTHTHAEVIKLCTVSDDGVISDVSPNPKHEPYFLLECRFKTGLYTQESIKVVTQDNVTFRIVSSLATKADEWGKRDFLRVDLLNPCNKYRFNKGIIKRAIKRYTNALARHE